MSVKDQARKFDFFPSPCYAFLQGADAQAFLEEFNARADETYKDAAKHIRVLRYDTRKQLITGSNPFAVAHVNALMRPQGIVTATQADLESFKENLRDCYEDSALVLRSAGDPDYADNDYVAKNLADQMPRAFKKSVGKVPLAVTLTDVDLIQDGKSAYGLRFQLREGAGVYEAPILAKERSKFRSEDVDTETGLPTKLGSGDRILYTREKGLSRLFLDWDLGVSSVGRNLANSGDYGRVVLNRGGAARAEQ